MSSQKRPQKRPAGQRPDSLNAASPSNREGADKPAGQGFLGSLLGKMSETQSRVAKGSAVSASLRTGAEKAADERQAFEDDTRRQLELEVVSRAEGDASFEFPPMEKPWRALLAEVAEEMGLYAHSTGEQGGRRVVVAKQPLPGQLEYGAEAASPPRAAGIPVKAASKGRVQRCLPPSPPALLTKLGTVKRDLRSVEEVQRDMKRQKHAAQAL
ncbi:hypothetical protein WJX72_009141 [[Myrmecia] bisecta]|uniref:R3H domain-containing protein n=1 Tax=[Myrmecia] bisecta TaxID=41462 RepID=A0AAW1PTM8_9CHLO